MQIVCLDLEGVLVPEIWIAFAEKTGVEELKRTTRDEPDYEVLMQYRLDILKKHSKQSPKQISLNYNNKIERKDLACIIYTSGTTGNPKGDAQSWWNFIKL